MGKVEPDFFRTPMRLASESGRKASESRNLMRLLTVIALNFCVLSGIASMLVMRPQTVSLWRARMRKCES